MEILPSSVPSDNSTVGCKLHLLVAVDTEDQQPVPLDVLSTSMQLSLLPPSPAAEAGTTSGKGRKAVAARKADAIILSPQGLWDAQQQIEGLEAAAAEAAAAAAKRGCVVWFSTQELTAAGQYTITAEYAESREQLLIGLSKQVGFLRDMVLHLLSCLV